MIGKDPKVVDKVLNSKDYQNIVESIFNMLYNIEEIKYKENLKENPRANIKVFNVPEGTSCLIRQPKENKIFIARRRYNYSLPNCVCISNEEREKYFAGWRNLNIDKVKGLYCIYKKNNPISYIMYSEYMDKLYEEQKNGN